MIYSEELLLNNSNGRLFYHHKINKRKKEVMVNALHLQYRKSNNNSKDFDNKMSNYNGTSVGLILEDSPLNSSQRSSLGRKLITS